MTVLPLTLDLRGSVKGEIRFSDGDRALYAADASNYREVPLGVVVPESVEDIAKTVSICSRYGASIVHRGGGTALAGQTVSQDSVVIDSSKYCHAILSIDPDKKQAVVEPGVVLDDLRHAANEFGLTFGPDPATHSHNTLGGMLGNNSCGVHSVYARRTVDNVVSLDIMTYDGLRMTVGKTSDETLARLMNEPGRTGEIYRGLKNLRDSYADEIRRRYPNIPRRVSGYNLDELLPENGFHVARALVGSEGTCVTILRATLHLVADPQHKLLLVIGFDDVVHAADAAAGILSYGPIGLEGIDEELVDAMRKKDFRVEDLKYLPEGKGWLLAQFGGDTPEAARAMAQRLQQAYARHAHVTGMRLVTEKSQREALWKVREAGLASTCWVPGMRDSWPGWEDSAVSPENLGRYMRDLKALYKKYGYHGAMYGHFGDGLIHTRPDFGLHTPQEVERFRRFMEEAAHLVVAHGGTLSGEHGDGRARAELLPIMFGEKLIGAFREFKHLWDPDYKMNPGKIVKPKPLDTDLRYGPPFEEKKPEYDTIFRFPGDERSFSRAAMRCVGVGECRRKEGGVMCPSYRATREEKHSTRGRARLLQEMLEHGPINNGWKSTDVAESLDLCLSCKGCRKDCPVQVDMATYRAEFYYHHYQHARRPVSSYSMGLVHRWAPLASRAPRLFNALTQTPGLSAIAKAVGGVHPKRHLPRFAHRTFRAQFSLPLREGAGVHTPISPSSGATRHPQGEKDIRALLWVDTFNNYFSPKALLAAAAVLQRCGYEVALSPSGLCCGRPFYDFGRLLQAREFLSRCIDSLAPLLDARTWLVGVEPSCLSVFRDEITGLFPDDARAKHISQRTLTLGAFLEKHGHPGIHFDRSVALHAHCHQHAVLGIEEDKSLLGASSPDFRMFDKGCCGMAGAFGYERHKFPVSRDIAEAGLMPAVRELPADTLLVADGFSCRHQISQFTGRQAVTLPEALLSAMGGA